MARYVAGLLPAPARVLVASHLELNPASRRLVQGMEALAGDALEALTPIDLSRRDERLAAVLAAPAPAEASPPPADGTFPRALRAFAGFDAADVPWRTKMPGFREFDFGEVDGCHVSLFWIRPGRKIPTHTHEGWELSLVLDGSFTDINGRYGRGDISVADESVDHRPTAGKEGPCIGFAVTDAPLKFNGPIAQRLTDILGF